MGTKEIRNKMRKERVKTFAKIITGASLGASLGILFAPKSGKETRKDIKNKSNSIFLFSKNVFTIRLLF